MMGLETCKTLKVLKLWPKVPMCFCLGWITKKDNWDRYDDEDVGVDDINKGHGHYFHLKRHGLCFFRLGKERK